MANLDIIILFWAQTSHIFWKLLWFWQKFHEFDIFKMMNFIMDNLCLIVMFVNRQYFDGY
jgi:hypothetical protein